MRLRSFICAVASVSNLLQVVSVTQLRAESVHKGAGDDAKAFANKASSRLRLLSDAAKQVMVTPSVEQDPAFSKALHKVSSQLQESATILQKWGADYAHNADANEMAVTLAEQGEVYEIQDLKKQLRAAIEADQEAQLEQPKKLAALSEKVKGLRSKLTHLVAEEAHQKPKKSGTMLISKNLWPRPPKNATKAEIGLFMHNTKMRVGKVQREEEDQEHLVRIETRLNRLEAQLKAASATVETAHANTLEARREGKELKGTEDHPYSSSLADHIKPFAF